MREILSEDICEGRGTAKDLSLLEKLANTMIVTDSVCGLQQRTESSFVHLKIFQERVPGSY